MTKHDEAPEKDEEPEGSGPQRTAGRIAPIVLAIARQTTVRRVAIVIAIAGIFGAWMVWRDLETKKPVSYSENLVVTASRLNCRAEPSINAMPLKKLDKDSVVTAVQLERVDGWVKLQVEGTDCWAKDEYLTKQSDEFSDVDKSLVQVMVLAETNALDRPSAKGSQIKRIYLEGDMLRGKWVLGGPEKSQRWFRVDGLDAMYLSEGKVLAEGFGLLTGRLSFPSEYIPKDMKVCAENIRNGSVVCAKDVNISEARYSLALPEGRYYIWSETADWVREPDFSIQKVYYTEAVPCGLSVNCPNRARKPVNVTSFGITSEIDPGDYYANN